MPIATRSSKGLLTCVDLVHFPSHSRIFISADYTESRYGGTASRAALCAGTRRAYHTIVAVAYQLSSIHRGAPSYTYSRKAVISPSEPVTPV